MKSETKMYSNSRNECSMPVYPEGEATFDSTGPTFTSFPGSCMPILYCIQDVQVGILFMKSETKMYSNSHNECS